MKRKKAMKDTNGKPKQTLVSIKAEHDAWLRALADEAKMPKARLMNTLLSKLREKGVKIEEKVETFINVG